MQRLSQHYAHSSLKYLPILRFLECWGICPNEMRYWSVIDRPCKARTSNSRIHCTAALCLVSAYHSVALIFWFTLPSQEWSTRLASWRAGTTSPHRDDWNNWHPRWWFHLEWFPSSLWTGRREAAYPKGSMRCSDLGGQNCGKQSKGVLGSQITRDKDSVWPAVHELTGGILVISASFGVRKP